MRYSFTDDAHSERFMKIFEINRINCRRCSNRYVAAVFLLTSNAVVWQRARDSIFATKIDFDGMNIGSLDTNAYAVYKLAKDIYNMKPNITMYDYVEHTLLNCATIDNLFYAINISNSGITVVRPQKERIYIRHRLSEKEKRS